MQVPLAHAWHTGRWAELVDASPGTPPPTEVNNPRVESATGRQDYTKECGGLQQWTQFSEGKVYTLPYRLPNPHICSFTLCKRVLPGSVGTLAGESLRTTRS